jgi:hypothetical protein
MLAGRGPDSRQEGRPQAGDPAQAGAIARTTPPALAPRVARTLRVVRRHRYPLPPPACPAQAALTFDREAPIHAADLFRIRMQV